MSICPQQYPETLRIRGSSKRSTNSERRCSTASDLSEDERAYILAELEKESKNDDGNSNNAHNSTNDGLNKKTVFKKLGLALLVSTLLIMGTMSYVNDPTANDVTKNISINTSAYKLVTPPAYKFVTTALTSQALVNNLVMKFFMRKQPI